MNELRSIFFQINVSPEWRWDGGKTTILEMGVRPWLDFIPDQESSNYYDRIGIQILSNEMCARMKVGRGQDHGPGHARRDGCNDA